VGLVHRLLIKINNDKIQKEFTFMEQDFPGPEAKKTEFMT
jgi:hypothetical protein